MKRISALLFVLCLVFTLTACSGQSKSAALIGGPDSKILVAYFSCTGNTGKVAEHIADILNGNLYEIVPEVPYTSAELEADNSSGRIAEEQYDEAARPAISVPVENMEDYDIVFLGYPIWWGDAPKIICTFLESYDFANKTIIPFCTSSRTGMGSSATDLHRYVPSSTHWLDGMRFPSSAARRAVVEWINELPLGVNKD